MFLGSYCQKCTYIIVLLVSVFFPFFSFWKFCPIKFFFYIIYTIFVVFCKLICLRNEKNGKIFCHFYVILRYKPGILIFTYFNIHDVTDCYIATQFPQSCKHLQFRIFAGKSASCWCLAGKTGI